MNGSPVRLTCFGRLLVAAMVCALGLPALGQVAVWGPESKYELAETVTLDEADNQVASEVQRAKAFLADRQWDEAIATLRQVSEDSGGKLWPIAKGRFVPVRDYCHLQLAALPPEALARYRAQVDPLAKRWYEQGVAHHDTDLLRRVVDELFASSWGDDTLAALGEMALESGDPASARAYWEKLLPLSGKDRAATTWLAYPETDRDLASIRARLVLASILEGARGRAAEELAQLKRLHPAARGKLDGREVDWAEALAAMLTESERWPERPPTPDWPTFAGASWRAKIAPPLIDVGPTAWRLPLGEFGSTTPGFSGGMDGSGGVNASVLPNAMGPVRTGPNLPFHPVIWNNIVLLAREDQILAVDLRSGKPAWGEKAAVFRDETYRLTPKRLQLAVTGSPEFTATVFRGQLFARMGEPITGRPASEGRIAELTYLVCVDLESEGRLAWKTPVPEDGWIFEGSPVSDGENVFVVLRRNDVRPQVHVACYDARSGEPRWRRFVCSAETPARGIFAEMTHDLLTLEHGTLYFNTNLGAIASLSARDGRINWITLYPRQRTGDLLRPEPFNGRMLNPCVYDRGRLFAAPRDSRRIFGLDAANGQILWQTPSQTEDVVHLLGVSDDDLIATGRRVYWIGLDRENQGKIRRVWPQDPLSNEAGRGVLAGPSVLWPTPGKLFVLDRRTAEVQRSVPLPPEAAAGANVLVTPRGVLLAAEDQLMLLGVSGGRMSSTDGSGREMKDKP